MTQESIMTPSSPTNINVNDPSPLPNDTQDSLQPVITSTQRDWCAILSTFVFSSALCTIGFILLAYNDASTGLVLLFVGGTSATLTVCAMLGKFQAKHNKDQVDRPPSYRLSWRRSFMRRLRQTHNQNGEEPPPEVREAPPQGTVQTSVHGNDDLPSSDMLSLSASTLVTRVEDATRVFIFDKRHTQSLSNITDPPMYEDALRSMDEAAKWKLKSELCLPLPNRL